MGTKLEVQVRHCFCCGLTPGAILIGLYTLFLYALLTGFAGWALTDTETRGDKPIYEDCELDAQGKLNPADSKKVTFTNGRTTIVMEDTSSYHCSFGMYTEEMKWEAGARYVFLVIALCLYIPLVLASIILLAGLCLSLQWLLLPWLILFPLDIIRGLISCFFIFLLSHGNLARIATGIFFLGLQFLHISLWIIMLAKFQQIRHRRRGNAIYNGGSQQYRQQPYGLYGSPASGSHPPPVSGAYSPQSGRRFADEYPQPTRYYDGPRY